MRELTIRLFRVEELSQEAQRKALNDERKNHYTCVKEMVEVFVEREIEKAGLPLDNLEIDFKGCQVSVSLSTDGPKSEKQLQIINDIIATVKEELPQLLDDDHMRAYIEADNNEFLEDGELWLY